MHHSTVRDVLVTVKRFGEGVLRGVVGAGGYGRRFLLCFRALIVGVTNLPSPSKMAYENERQFNCSITYEHRNKISSISAFGNIEASRV